ncbi:TIGR03086 family protein [Rhodococcus hoagii]|nr:TIGR03086 family protein [Prescottella equi]
MITTESTPDLYRRLAAAFTDRVDAVPADRWEAASPCEGWTARDVLTHVVETQSHMVGVVGLSSPTAPPPRTIRLRRGGTPATPCRRSWTTPRRPRSSTTGTSGAPIWPPRCALLLFRPRRSRLGHRPGGGARRDDPRRRSRPARRRRRAVGRFAPYDGVCGPALDVPGDADRQTRILATLGRSS